MSSSTTAATSPARPATEAPRATAWLRVALLAGLAGALAAISFDLLVAEHVVDRAVAAEGAHVHVHASLALREPFSRQGQRGGLVLGELLLGAGVGFLLAGVLTFLGPRARSPRRLWLLACAACAWGVVVLPALVYPALPPGVASALPIGERQLLYLATVAVGIGGVAGAAHLWAAGRRSLAAAAVLVPAALAVALFPDQRAAHAVTAALLRDFRAVALGSQLLFWGALALAGSLALGRST